VLVAAMALDADLHVLLFLQLADLAKFLHRQQIHLYQLVMALHLHFAQVPKSLTLNSFNFTQPFYGLAITLKDSSRSLVKPSVEKVHTSSTIMESGLCKIFIHLQNLRLATWLQFQLCAS
jgi:hypothetical protein